MQVVHEETQKFSLMMGLLVLGSMVIIGAYLVIQWQKGVLSELSTWPYIFLGLILILDIFFIANFYQLKIILTNDRLIFGFGILRRKIKLSDIKEITLEKFDFQRYMGYGVRTGRDKSIGYVARNSDGIRLKVANQKDFFITSDDASRLKSMIESQLGGSKSYEKEPNIGISFEAE